MIFSVSNREGFIELTRQYNSALIFLITIFKLVIKGRPKSVTPLPHPLWCPKLNVSYHQQYYQLSEWREVDRTHNSQWHIFWVVTWRQRPKHYYLCTYQLPPHDTYIQIHFLYHALHKLTLPQNSYFGKIVEQQSDKVAPNQSPSFGYWPERISLHRFGKRLKTI